MKVFSVYLKVFKSLLPIVLIYAAVFLGIAMLFVFSGGTEDKVFKVEKTHIAYINNDKKTDLLDGYYEYLSNYAIFVDVKESEIEDALFFEQISVAIIIPNGFSDNFFNETMNVNTKGRAENINAVTINNITKDYFSYYKTYALELKKENVKEEVLDTLSKEVIINYEAPEKTEMGNASRYFNYLSYILLAISVNIISIIMIRIRKGDIRKRISVSSYKESRINLELILGNAIVVFGMSIILSVVYFFLDQKMIGSSGLLLLVNALCFSIPTLGMGYLLGSVIKNENIVGMITNVLALGSSFLCGAFVPQMWLSKEVLYVAHLFPTYYFIKANDIIGAGNVSLESRTVALMLIMQIIFGVLLFIISYFINKKAITKEN